MGQHQDMWSCIYSGVFVANSGKLSWFSEFLEFRIVDKGLGTCLFLLLGVAESPFLDISAVGRSREERGKAKCIYFAPTVCPAQNWLFPFCDPIKGLGACGGPPGPHMQGKGQLSLV